jgi:hypothetical protein
MRRLAAAAALLQNKMAWTATAIFIIVFIVLLYIFRLRTGNVPIEKFSAGSAAGIFCPPGTKYYISLNGDEECCNGEVNGNKCVGKAVCTMSSSMKLPSCRGVLEEHLKKRSREICPKELPNYFERSGMKACTASELRHDNLQPINPSAATCKVYPTTAENMRKDDSCYIKKQLSDMKCLTPNCTKAPFKNEWWYPNPPLLITQTFNVPGEFQTRTCTTRNSVINYTQNVPAKYSEKKTQLENIIVNSDGICENAYRKYVEKRAD